ncbi:MAG TPA: DEAD/DEAH box helicase, partial [Planctomycetaceae bacterium]|nr:DEAD/DEAH box helicase [Planctomycetaceae bacterium]
LVAMVYLALQSLHDRQPEIYRLLQDVAEHELEQWERIDELAPGDEPENDEVSDIPSLPETTPTRLFWTIEWNRSGLDILPRLQVPRKRGNGWVKGTLLLLHDFLECRDLPHPVDRALKDIVSIEAVGRPYMDSVQALMILADHDLVEMDGEPVEILVHGFTPCIHREGDRFCVSIGPEREVWRQGRVRETPTGYVISELNSQRLHVIPVSHSWKRFAWELVASRPFPRGVLKHVLAQLVPHSERIGIRLPEEMGAPLVDSPADLHLVLRSSPRSELECALRVRDAKGRFFAPTEGPAVFLDTLEGKKIQRARDIRRENREAFQARYRLHLDRASEIAPWTWRLPTIDDALELLQRAEELAAEGLFSVVWDPSTTHPMRVVGPIEPKNLVVRVKRKRDWFGLEGSCRAPAGEIPVEQLLEGVDGHRHGRYTEIRPGEFAEIAHEFASQLRRLRDTVHGKPGELEIGETAALALRDLAEQQKVSVTSDRHWQACLQRLSTAEALDPVPPEGLLAELRDYQVEGYRWLRRLSEWGVGACLADDMGLGKTVQMLAVLLDRASRGPALVIAPTSVGFNWLREA